MVSCEMEIKSLSHIHTYCSLTLSYTHNQINLCSLLALSHQIFWHKSRVLDSLWSF